MPYDEPAPDDPSMLVGVGLPGSLETTRAMVEAFADEFAALGLGREEIRTLFRMPAYTAPHAAWQQMGDAEISRIVDESVGFWGRLRFVVRDQRGAEERDRSSLVRPGGFLKMQR
jgi:hypothetical protein